MTLRKLSMKLANGVDLILKLELRSVQAVVA
jgi:hypothetical protein